MQKKVLFGIIIIVIVAIIALGGLFAYKYFVPLAQNKIAGWKTYTNTQYEYQINYPTNAKAEQDVGGGITLQYENGVIEICSVGVGACGNVPGIAGNEIKTITRKVNIDGKTYNIGGWIYEGSEYLHLSLPENMSVSLNIPGKNIDVENNLLKMLSTFKFTTTANQSQTDLSLNDINNATYILVGSAGDITAKFKNGNYQIDNNTDTIEASIVQDRIAFGDLDGDGRNDVAAIINIDYESGAGNNAVLYVMLNKVGKPVYFAQQFLGLMITVKSISINDGIISLDVINHGTPAEPQNVEKIIRFRLSGNKLVNF